LPEEDKGIYIHSGVKKTDRQKFTHGLGIRKHGRKMDLIIGSKKDFSHILFLIPLGMTQHFFGVTSASRYI